MVDSTACGVLRLELLDDVPVARLTESVPDFDNAVDLLTAAICTAVAEGHPHLLMDGRACAFAAPSLAERLHMVRLWAEAADGRLRIAMLVRPSFIDPDRFGVVAAGNFGLASQVFAHEAEALAWLREEHAAQLQRGAGPRGD